jgi:flagellar protein FlaF
MMAEETKFKFDSKREMDAAAFSQAAYVMDQARQKLNDKELGERALKYNQMLWSIVQADVAQEDNTLPEELKANLMSLSIYVDKQTTIGLEDPSDELFDGLISINLNIAEGLMEKS